LKPLIFTEIKASAVEDPLSPVVQVMAVSVTEVIIQVIPSSSTSTSPTVDPNPLPSI